MVSEESLLPGGDSVVNDEIAGAAVSARPGPSEAREEAVSCQSCRCGRQAWSKTYGRS